MKRNYLIPIMFLMLALSCTGKSGNVANMTADTHAKDTATHTVTMLFAGDLMQHGPQIRAAKTANGYDYSDVFARVKPEISAADIAVANFEVTLAGEPYSGYPQFSAPDDYLRASIDAGFDVFTTANNHCCDTRAKGLRRTIDMMDSLKAGHLGTYKSAKEREHQTPYIIEKNGIRICLLSFTYGTNGIPVPSPFVVNLIDTVQIARDVAKAKAAKADVIIALPHWGIEYQQLPNKEQVALADWMLRHGIDHVIGGHPHVIQPFEQREINGTKHLVAYSLGNYVSNQSKPNTDGGAMVKIRLTKKAGKTQLTECGYMLHWVSRPVVSGRKNYRIYPVSYPDTDMNAQEKSLRSRFIELTHRLLDKHNKNVGEAKPTKKQ